MSDSIPTIEQLEAPAPSPSLFTLPQRERVIAALTPVGFTFSMGVPTPDRLMQYIGTTRDQLTTIQLIGPADKLDRAGMLIGYPKNAPGLGTFQGKAMIILVSLLIPGWTDAPRLVAIALQNLYKKSPAHIDGPQHQRLTFNLAKKYAYLTMEIKWPRSTL